jgi:hypothetical protein
MNTPPDATSELRPNYCFWCGAYGEIQADCCYNCGNEIGTYPPEIATEKRRWEAEARKAQAVSDLQVVFDTYSGSISPDFAFEIMKERIAALKAQEGTQ